MFAYGSGRSTLRGPGIMRASNRGASYLECRSCKFGHQDWGRDRPVIRDETVASRTRHDRGGSLGAGSAQVGSGNVTPRAVTMALRPPAASPVVLDVAAVVLVLAIGWRYGTGGGEAADISRTPASLPGDAPSPGPQVLVVDVSGEVRRAGVYRLPTGARVLDAVRKARAGRRADLDALNLAARLTDGEQMVVPRRGPVRPGLRCRRRGSGGTGLAQLGDARAARDPRRDRPGARAADHRLPHAARRFSLDRGARPGERHRPGPARGAARPCHAVSGRPPLSSQPTPDSSPRRSTARCSRCSPSGSPAAAGRR